MPSDKPRITLRLEHEEMEYLEKWAKEEFLSVPQLTRVIIKRALAAKKNQQNDPPASPPSKRRDNAGGKD